MPAALRDELQDHELTPEGVVVEIDEEEQARLEDEAKAAEAERRAVIQALGQRLRSTFDKRKTDRQEIERRWHRDTRQYNGIYEQEIEEGFKERKYASKVFVPLTRRICNVVEARLGDLLFPTDDRNFVISESPVPELADAEALAKKLRPEQPVDVDGQPIRASAIQLGIREVREEAKRKATNMQRKVDDQLKECAYHAEARKVIHDAIKLGTGVLKGPVVLGRTKKRWTVQGNVATLLEVEDLSPVAKRVDPWNFYPDLSASEVKESDFYELHRMTKAQLAKLARQPGFDADAIRRIIEAGTTANRDQNLDERREAAGTANVEDRRYNLVEYTGSVDTEELIACGCKIDDDDPLLAYDATVWFSEFTGEVVKAILNPMDTDAPPYSVFNWQPDTASIFGYGLPYEIRDLQDAGNSSFRAMLDNMGLAVGGQTVVNSKKVRPVNGNWTIEPNKIWDVTDGASNVSNVFGFYQMESRSQELLAIFQAIKAVAEEIGGPMMAMQGQDAPSYVQAGATGMSIAYNAASIWMRRAVMLWDDQITMPTIGRFVDWNMQYSDDPEIKGDLHVIARGTSALLEAEGQAQRLQAFIQLAAGVGVPVRKMVNQLRALAKAMRLDPDDLLPDDAEVKEMEEAAKRNGPPPNPEMERIKLRQAEIADRQEERRFMGERDLMQARLRMAEIASRENLSMEQAAAKYEIDMAKIEASLLEGREKRAHESQKLNAELAMKAAAGSGI